MIHRELLTFPLHVAIKRHLCNSTKRWQFQGGASQGQFSPVFFFSLFVKDSMLFGVSCPFCIHFLILILNFYTRIFSELLEYLITSLNDHFYFFVNHKMCVRKKKWCIWSIRDLLIQSQFTRGKYSIHWVIWHMV